MSDADKTKVVLPEATTGKTVSAGDATNNAVRVNIVAGGGGGGNAAAGTTGAAVPASAGYTGYNSGGNLVGVSTANPLPVSAQGTTAVSAASLPLPAGAALEAGHLATIDTSTARIPAQGQALAAASMPVVLPAAQITTLTPPAAITGFALDATLTGGTQKTKVVDSAGVNALAVNASGQVAISNFPATQAISAASLPLPATAATDASITNGNLRGTVALSAGSAAVGTVGVTSLPALPAGSNAIGTVTVGNASLAITAAALPLPAGAALDATLTGGSQVSRVTVAGSVGQQLSAASLPVVTASDQAEIYYARGARQVQETRLLAEQDVARQSYSTRTNDRVGFLLQRGGR